MNKQPAPSSPHVGDQHWGKGGRFVVIDGKRVPANAVPPAPTSDTAPATESTAKKGK